MLALINALVNDYRIIMKLPNFNLNQSISLNIYARGWLSAFVIIGITLLLLANLFRVTANAANNYEVYLYERESVESLRDESERLNRELAYYNSYEYKKLYARDFLHLAEPGEKLYKIVGTPKYYDLQEQELELFEEGNLLEWWLRII